MKIQVQLVILGALICNLITTAMKHNPDHDIARTLFTLIVNEELSSLRSFCDISQLNLNDSFKVTGYWYSSGMAAWFDIKKQESIKKGDKLFVKPTAGTYVFSPLCLASDRELLHVVNILIEQGADINYEGDLSLVNGVKLKKSALEIAITKHNSLLIQQLIGQGAKITHELYEIAEYELQGHIHLLAAWSDVRYAYSRGYLKKMVGIIVAVVVVCALAGLGGYIALHSMHDGEASEEAQVADQKLEEATHGGGVR